MSWSVHYTGKPADVAKAIQAQYDNMSDSSSKKEFGDALPHLLALVNQTKYDEVSNTGSEFVKVNAGGSASWDYSDPNNPKRLGGSMTINIDPIYISAKH